MSNAAQPSLLRRLMGLRTAEPAQQTDPADMGTAMGLDYSLDEPPAEVLVVGSAAHESWLRNLGAS
jgi:hypothetical protein